MNDRKGVTSLQKFLDQLGITPLGALCLVVLAVVPFIPPFTKEYLRRWLIMGILLGSQSMAFDFTAGYIGIVNFGFCAFMGLGAYTSAILASKVGVSPWFGMFIGIAPAALLGFLTGVLTLRLRGIFAAVMAWFVGLALMGIATKWVPLTEGPLGLNTPTLLKTTSNLPYFYIIFVMMLVVYIVLKKVVRSPFGLAFQGDRPEHGGCSYFRDQPNPISDHQFHTLLCLGRMAGRVLCPLSWRSDARSHVHLQDD